MAFVLANITFDVQVLLSIFFIQNKQTTSVEYILQIKAQFSDRGIKNCKSTLHTSYQGVEPEISKRGAK